MREEKDSRIQSARGGRVVKERKQRKKEDGGKKT